MVDDVHCAIGTAHHALLFVICSAMWLAYDVYLVRTVLHDDNSFLAVTGGDTGCESFQPKFRVPAINHQHRRAQRSMDVPLHSPAAFQTTPWLS